MLKIARKSKDLLEKVAICSIGFILVTQAIQNQDSLMFNNQ